MRRASIMCVPAHVSTSKDPRGAEGVLPHGRDDGCGGNRRERRVVVSVMGGWFVIRSAYRHAGAAPVGAREQATAAVIAAREQAAAAINAARHRSDAQPDVLWQTFRYQATAAHRTVRRTAEITCLGSVDQTGTTQPVRNAAPTNAGRNAWTTTVCTVDQA